MGIVKLEWCGDYSLAIYSGWIFSLVFAENNSPHEWIDSDAFLLTFSFRQFIGFVIMQETELSPYNHVVTFRK